MTATSGAGTRVKTATQTITVTVTNVDEGQSGTVTIDDTTPMVDDELTASTASVADPDGLPDPFAPTWKWYRTPDGGSETEITGETSATYTVVATDLGATLTAKARWTDNGGFANTLSSAPTSAVAAASALPTLSIGTGGAPESTIIGFAVILSATASADVTVTCTASFESGDTASAADLSTTTGTATINAGSTSALCRITPVQDTIDEEDETFTVTLSGVSSNAQLAADPTAKGTINDDDDPPTVSVADVSGTEGTALTFTVTLSDESGKTVTVDYATSVETGDTATSGTDFTAKTSTTLTFDPVQEEKTFTVQTTDDTDIEEDETFTVTLSNPSNATISDATATGTINDDDATDDCAATTTTTCEVDVGGSATGTSESAGDFDWFRVVLEADTRYQIDLEGAATVRGTLANPAISVRDASAMNLASDDNSGVGNNARVIYTPTAAGAYYVQTVGISGGDTGTYTLSVIVLGANGNSEADTDFPIAPQTTGRVEVGASATGTIDSAGDFDWFKVVLEAGKTYQIDLEGVDGGGGTLADPYLDNIRDSESEEIDDTGNDDIGGEDDIRDSQITFTPTDAGAYYLVAAHAGSASGTYTLSVRDTTTVTLPTLSVGNASATEGAVIAFPLTLTVAASAAVTVTCTASIESSDTAVAADLLTTTSTATINVGSTAATCPIATKQDSTDEEDETFTVTLSTTSSNAQLATDPTAKGTIIDDDTAPTITDVAITSTPVLDTDTYGAGETILVTVTFSEAVTVTGEPHVEYNFAGTTVEFPYESGSGTTALVFAYTVAPSDEDDNGIFKRPNGLKVGTGESIVSAAGVAADLDYEGGDSGERDHKVDGSRSIVSVEVTSTPQLETDTYGAGETILFTVTFTAKVDVTGDPVLEFLFDGSEVRQAGDVSGGGTTELVFSYTVVSGDDDDNGLFLRDESDYNNPDGPVRLDSDDEIEFHGTSTDAPLYWAGRGDAVGPQGGRLADDGQRRTVLQLVGDVRRGGEPDDGGHGAGDGLRCGRQRHGLRDHRRGGPDVLLHRGDLGGADLRRGPQLRGRGRFRHEQHLRGRGDGDQRGGDAGEDGDADHHGDGDRRGHGGAGQAGRADGVGGVGDEPERELVGADQRGSGHHGLRRAVPGRQQRRLDERQLQRHGDHGDADGPVGEHVLPGAGAGDQ